MSRNYTAQKKQDFIAALKHARQFAIGSPEHADAMGIAVDIARRMADEQRYVQRDAAQAAYPKTRKAIIKD